MQDGTTSCPNSARWILICRPGGPNMSLFPHFRCCFPTLTFFAAQFLPMFDKVTEGLLPKPHTKLGSWHLLYLGVMKEHQKKGIGRALIRDREELVITLSSCPVSAISLIHRLDRSLQPLT